MVELLQWHEKNKSTDGLVRHVAKHGNTLRKHG
jgi:hypothetical protein